MGTEERQEVYLKNHKVLEAFLSVSDRHDSADTLEMPHAEETVAIEVTKPTSPTLAIPIWRFYTAQHQSKQVWVSGKVFPRMQI